VNNVSKDKQTNWNIIRSHQWSDKDYEEAQDWFLKWKRPKDMITNENDSEQQKNVKAKALHNFKQKMSYYGYDEKGNIVLQANDGIHIVYPESKVMELLASYRKNIETDARNEKTLYAKIVANNIIGVKRKHVIHYLKKQDFQLKSFISTADKPIVKSYRPVYPFEHWQMDYIVLNKQEIVKENQGYAYIL